MPFPATTVEPTPAPSPAAFVRLSMAAVLGSLCIGLSACSPISLAMTAAGIATDTSITWEIAKHLHGKLTEDDPRPCRLLNSAQRALSARCDYEPGSIDSADLTTVGLQQCPLAVAARDPRLWRALPELLEKGARFERCSGSPLATLAAADPCPDFEAASPPVLAAFERLAEEDPRAVHHDVFRMLGCPQARRVGLDRVLMTWLDRGRLDPAKLSFSPLDAASPDLLVTRFGHELEVAGHAPEAALGTYDGSLPSGFEEALRTSHWPALEWWLYRLPQLANMVPPTRGAQLPWVPLHRVLQKNFLAYPQTQADMVTFLMARGANPRQALPYAPGTTVLTEARQARSPLVALLDGTPTQPPNSVATARRHPAPAADPLAGTEVALRHAAGPASAEPAVTGTIAAR